MIVEREGLLVAIYREQCRVNRRWGSTSIVVLACATAIGRLPSAMVGLMPRYGACLTRPGFCGILAIWA
jgi:hypothetical protein